MSRVECLLCPKRCQLVEGERGDCKVRLNLEGKLKTLIYGKACAVHVDPIEKKPLSHVLPGSGSLSIATAGCNLHCKFCQNWEISQREPEETDNYDLSPEDAVGGIAVYDVAGRRVRTLVSPASGAGRPTSLVWDLRDDTGNRVTAGAYWVHGGDVRQKIVVLR